MAVAAAKEEEEEEVVVMAPMFQGFPVHVGGVRSFVWRGGRRGRRGLRGGDLQGTTKPLRSPSSSASAFVASILVFNLTPRPPLRLLLPPLPTTAPHLPLLI